MSRAKPTYLAGEIAHYGTHVDPPRQDQYCVLPDGFGLDEDYDRPRSYVVLMCDNCGRLTGAKRRCKVNHDATGTATTGPGDTVMYTGPLVR